MKTGHEMAQSVLKKRDEILRRRNAVLTAAVAATGAAAGLFALVIALSQPGRVVLVENTGTAATEEQQSPWEASGSAAEETDTVIPVKKPEINEDVISELGMTYRQLSDKYGCEPNGIYNAYVFPDGKGYGRYVWKSSDGRIFDDDMESAGGCNMIDGINPEELFNGLTYPISFDELANKYEFCIISTNNEITMDYRYWAELSHQKYDNISFIFATTEYGSIDMDTSVCIKMNVDCLEAKPILPGNVTGDFIENLNSVIDSSKSVEELKDNLENKKADFRNRINSIRVFENPNDFSANVQLSDGDFAMGEIIYVAYDNGKVYITSWGDRQFNPIPLMFSCIIARADTAEQLISEMDGYNLSLDEEERLTSISVYASYEDALNSRGNPVRVIMENGKWAVTSGAWDNEGAIRVTYQSGKSWFCLHGKDLAKLASTDGGTDAAQPKTEAEFYLSEEGLSFQIAASKAATAYLKGNREELSKYLADPDYDAGLSDSAENLYEKLEYMVLRLPDPNQALADNNGVHHAVYQFAVKGTDMLFYLDVGLIKTDKGWKVTEIGLQG